MTHTPGPWEAKRLVDADGEHYTTLYQAHIDIGGVCMVWAPAWHLEQEANAKLIAAAPDLLAACEQALALIGTDDESSNGCGDPVEVAHDLRQAIKKARGQ